MKGKVAIVLAIAALLVGLLVFAVGWEAVVVALRQARLSVYALAFGGTVWCLLCRSVVWHRVLSVVDRPRPIWLVMSIFLVAMFGKYIAPYGQVTSGVGLAAVVSRYFDTSYETSLAAILSADFINYLPYLTLGGFSAVVSLLFFIRIEPVSPYVPVTIVAIGVLIIVLGFAWQYRTVLTEVVIRVLTTVRSLVERFAPSRAHHFDRENVTRRLRGFSTTIDLISTDRWVIVGAVAVAHLGWLGLAAALYVTAVAVQSPIPFAIAMVSVALSKLGFVVPTPGGVGGVEATLAAVLYLISPMSGAVALVVAILYRFATYWFTVVLGGLASMALAAEDPTPPDLE